jgi:hypothetical protein
MIGKVRVLALLVAGVLFAPPWVELQLNEKPYIHQSGFQIIYGGRSLGSELKKRIAQVEQMSGGKLKVNRSRDDFSKSILVGGAFLLIVLSLLSAFAALGDTNPKAGAASGLLAAIALSLIAVQMLMNFPIEQRIEEGNAKQKETMAANELPRQVQMNQMDITMERMVKVNRLPWPYGVLILLAIPSLLAALSLRQMRDQNDYEEEFVPEAE